MQIMKGKSCVCCGSREDLSIDHIAPIIWRNHGYDNASNPRNYICQPSAFQILCRRCNQSKGDDRYCLYHWKYLGVWNYLPKLPLMEPDEAIGILPLKRNGR